MKSVKEVNILSNIANITNSFNIDVGDILSGNNFLNNNTLLSGLLSNNSILDGGLLNGNDVDVSPTIDLGLVGDIGDVLPVNVLSNNLASPVNLVGDVLSGNGDLSVLNSLTGIDVGGITPVVSDAVDVLSNVKITDGIVNVLTDALNVDVTGNTLTGLVANVQDLDVLNAPTAIVGDILSPNAVLSDVLDAPIVANVANIAAPVTALLDADFLNTDIAGDVLSGITSVIDTDVGANLVGAIAGLDVTDVGNILGDVTSVIGADTDLIGAVTSLDVSDITGNILSNLTSNLDLGGLGGGIDLGDVGALIGADAVADIVSLASVNTLIEQIDLFAIPDAEAA